MTGSAGPADHRERLQNALRAIQKLQAKIEALESARAEPIAVIGVACRFPGQASNVESFWRLLSEGVDAVAEVPAERWDVDAYFDPDPEAPGKTYVRSGGFLQGIDHFDPHFFGISPREAVNMDPQHRLLLEVSWAALEDAGLPPAKLAGSRSGVFVGITTNDYAQISRSAGAENLNAYHLTGCSLNFVAGRLSYLLGLHGPSMALDTACSSSLVSVHLACQSLRTGESDLALAGGVNLILAPDGFITASKASMLARDGRCKTFDAAADGFGRGEGCGVAVLKRLSRAVEDGDRILAVIRGSAVNQDGASSGLTVPNKLAQEALIREALRSAGVEPHEVQYVEAHGTGTPLGDPIEVRALAAVLGKGRRPDAPFYLGSVKTNIGHLESASGIAGFIKVVLALQHREIPPHLHFRDPTPHVAWREIPAVVPTQRTPWPAGAGRRIAGVSSFGASGTNAHVILEEAPTPAAGAQPERPHHLLTLSARTESALRAQAENHRRHLAATSDSLADVAYTANTGRSHFAHRLAVLGASAEQVEERLAEFLAGGTAPGVAVGRVKKGERPKIAFLFTGQGAQYVNMGRQLFETSPTFRAALERCEQILQPYLERPLLSLLYPSAGEEAEAARLLEQTAYTQPALFALEYALCELWRSWGIEPAAVLGHSVGEYLAACVAGVFSLEEGLALIAERGRLMQALPEGGMMVAVRAEEALVAEAIAPHSDTVSLAAVNGPQSVVISGAGAQLEEIVASLRARGIDCKPLAVSHAFHSPLLEPALAAFEAAAGRITMRAPQLRLVSNLTGEVAGAELTQPGYWRRHAREPVRFTQGMRTLEELGCTIFLEIGPHPVLLGMGQNCTTEGRGLWLPSLRKGREEWPEVLGSLQRLHVQGIEVDWAGVDRGYSRRKVALPTYPFEGGRYWIEPRADQGIPPARSRPLPPHAHPLLGQPLRAAARQRIFEVELSTARVPFLADHRVRGAVVFPATAYLEAARAGAESTLGAGRVVLDDVIFHEPLILSDAAARTVQLVLTPEGDGVAGFEVFSLEDAHADRWRLHAAGRLRVAPEAVGAPEPASLATLEAAFEEELPVAEHYQQLGLRGLDFGEAFQGVTRLLRQEERRETLARVRLPEALAPRDGVYLMHPATLDACLQPLGALLPSDRGATYLPMSVTRLSLHAPLPAEVWSHGRVRPAEPGTETLAADVRVYDHAGDLLLEVEGISFRPTRTEGGAPGENPRDWLYEVAWHAQPRSSAALGAVADCSVGRIVEALQAHTARLSASPEAQLSTDLFARLERVGGAYIAHALQHLGWSFRVGERVSAAALAERLGIHERYSRLLARLLDTLVEDGVLQPTREGWEVVRAPEPVDPEAELEALFAEFPDSGGELRLMRRCGRALGAALRGEQDPLELLFPGGSLTEAESLYQDSPLSRGFNQLVREAVAAALAQFPDGRKVRVLEIGGGTGGTTSHLLPLFSPGSTEYLFTDISPLFTKKAKQKFEAYPFVRYQTLDIARQPAGQGFEPEGFDLIVAANVLHATPDLRQTLRHVQSLLAPGGLLVLLEALEPRRFGDLTVGLTDGWWNFADTDLRSYALMPSGRWLDLLAELGFEEANAVSGKSAFSQQAVIVARAPTRSSAASDQPGSWLILSDATGVGEALAAALRARGESCLRVLPGESYGEPGDGAPGVTLQVDPSDPAHLRRLVREGSGPEFPPLRNVLHLWALDEPSRADGAPDSSGRLAAAQRAVTGSALHLVRSLAEAGVSPRLFLVTRGTQAALAGEQIRPLHASLWGLGKAIAQEHPEFRCVRLDLAPAASSGEVEALLAEVLEPDAEDQVALRQQGRYVPRLVRRAAEPRQELPVPSPHPYQLHTAGPAALESLHLRPLERRPPGAGEVEIEVLATGLGFRDVLSALGEYPGGPVPFGSECAGTVAAVGEGVEDLAVGDPVLAVAFGSFQSFVTTGAEFVARKPARLSFAEAAAIPSAFLTSSYALHHLARITAGDRVLVHAAAGGVGMAAVQLARRAGAEVFGTAGTPAKRALLESLGVRHVFDSRSAAFAEEILRLTGGEGVNVVLNSLSGEFIPQSLEVLARNGCFIELGRRGIWDPEQVAEVRPDVAYFVVDLAASGRADPTLIRSLFGEVLQGFDEGTLEPLPMRVFGMPEVVSAFRHMAQARHTGKIVLTHHRPDLRSDATYLITGGLGGLGLAVARWMSDQGARHLVLLGRNAPSEEARRSLAELEKAGTQVVVARADVSRTDEVERVLAEIGRTMPPLRGVIHSAGTLDDGMLLQQDWSRFERVFAPKVEGGWLLHTLTRGLPLDFFVIFSSAVSLVGSPGQGNHVAASSFLDALAHHRLPQGLPALSIDWGPWSEVGAAAARQMNLRALTRGARAITPQQGVRVFGELLRETSPVSAQVGVMAIDWAAFLDLSGAQQSLPLFFSELAREARARAPARGAAAEPRRENAARSDDLMRQLEEAPATRRTSLLQAHVRAQAIKVLGLESGYALDPRQPLQELGLDSLMAVELRNLLGSGLALRRVLPASLAFDYPTLEALTGFLAKELFGAPAAAGNGAANGDGGAEAAARAEVEQLTDSEAEELLLAELEAMRTLR